MAHQLGRSMMLVLAVAASGGCTKIPISDVAAGFELADAVWFEDEETLFIFYTLSAEQGLSTESRIEVRYRTDDEIVDWAPVLVDQDGVGQLADPDGPRPLVHLHLPVDCGFARICGSLSVHVPLMPRDVGVRLRYHRAGATFLNAETILFTVGSGPPHTSRSLIVYGVFDESNRRVQWRGRHRFPNLRNEQVQELGLRRRFRIEAQRYTFTRVTSGNPYGYGDECPDDATPIGFAPVETIDRAVFNPELLPLDGVAVPTVCARSVVHEPKAPFVSSARARKNPETELAFPVLRSPVRNATPIKYFLAPCQRTISEVHAQMQRQRIQYDGPTYCIDDWRSDRFVPDLVADLRAAIERTRPDADDMVVVVGLHRDDEAVADRLEEALNEILPAERERSTPRVVGAFVFDSDIRDVENETLRRLVLWCPATILDENDPEVELPNPSQISCGIVPDNTFIDLGPFTLSALPILASRPRYLEFIDMFSEGEAGQVRSLTFLAPEFTPTTDNSELFGAVTTFFNGERIFADTDDAFSFCDPGSLQSFVFRSEVIRSLECGEVDPGEDCIEGAFLPIVALPEWHRTMPEMSYELGLGWDFPWLLRMEYEIVGAASANVFGLSLPFGVGGDVSSDFGSGIWTASEFPLGPVLLQCQRFCDHPTFDSAGVYNVTQPFRETYGQQCYLPRFPTLGDSSFPLDP